MLEGRVNTAGGQIRFTSDLNKAYATGDPAKIEKAYDRAIRSGSISEAEAAQQLRFTNPERLQAFQTSQANAQLAAQNATPLQEVPNTLVSLPPPVPAQAQMASVGNANKAAPGPAGTPGLGAQAPGVSPDGATLATQNPVAQASPVTGGPSTPKPEPTSAEIMKRFPRIFPL